MSDASQGPGWWRASDGKWYPPQSAPRRPAVSGKRLTFWQWFAVGAATFLVIVVVAVASVVFNDRRRRGDDRRRQEAMCTAVERAWQDARQKGQRVDPRADPVAYNWFLTNCR